MRVVCQKWEESERGWGSRPDGYSLHLTDIDRQLFINKYWDRMPATAPSEYSRPDGEPYNVRGRQKDLLQGHGGDRSREVRRAMRRNTTSRDRRAAGAGRLEIDAVKISDVVPNHKYFVASKDQDFKVRGRYVFIADKIYPYSRLDLFGGMRDDLGYIDGRIYFDDKPRRWYVFAFNGEVDLVRSWLLPKK